MSFPYNPLQWGPVSSWLTVFVYSVNAVLLYKALRAQQMVQKNQQKQTDLQRYLVREKIKPRYAVQLAASQNLDDETNLSIIARAKFRLNQHEAHMVSFPHELKFFGIRPAAGLPLKELEHHLRNTEISYDFMLRGEVLEKEFRNGKIEIEFNLHSRDDFQNEYVQAFIFSFFINTEKSVTELVVEVQSFEPLLTVIHGVIFNSA